MPYMPFPKFKSVKPGMLEISNPGIGGLNLYDLEYEQEVIQSPYMKNMMYRNGTFSKRYGQETTAEYTYTNKIYATEYFDRKLIVHSGTKMYVDKVEQHIMDGGTEISLAEEEGIFIKFYQTLYYYCGGTIFEYKLDTEVEPHEWKWGIMKPYVPEVFTECQPQKDGTYNMLDQYNLLTLDYKCVYSSPGTSTVDYYPYGDKDNRIDWDNTPVVKVEVDDQEKVLGTDYNVDKVNKKVTFINGHVPAKGDDNVSITFRMKEENLKEDRERLLKCKYHINYGANGNSHLFLGGGGDSKIFYSESYNASYFPENNWIIIGSTEHDVTGFGLQYNVLIAFKPNEIYQLFSYQVSASMVTSEDEKLIGTEAFGANVVNGDMGCNCPKTIQLINNQLTWYSTRDGVCTLVSTNISDERNVRVISRNINHTNNFGIIGVLDHTETPDEIVAYDYDNKYFLVFNVTGDCFTWDYEISPFVYTASKMTDPRKLDWFWFDHFYVKQFLKIEDELTFVPTIGKYEKNIVRLTSALYDLDFNDDGESDAIESFYMTPFLQFNAVEYLKNVTNIFIQCRGDTPSKFDIYYYTDESGAPEKEPESIYIGGRVWNRFSWETFQWEFVNWAKVFRRRCSLKKIQMASFYVENKEANRDLAISHMGLQYQIVKTIR